MPYKDPTKQAAQQRDKWTLWREMKDGFADEAVCRKCGLPIFALSEDRFSLSEQRFYHFVDPVALGIRPLGRNDPVYDLVRRCDVAVKHRFVPEAFEDHDGNFQGLDPRAGAYRDLALLAEERIANLTTKDVATP